MKNFVNLVIGLIVVSLAVMAPLGLVGGGAFFAATAVAENDPDLGMVLMIAAASVVGIIAVFVALYLAGGITDVMLRTARGEKTTIGQFFGGGRFMGKMFVGGFCQQLAVGIASLACLVPGVILSLGLALWTFLVVDRNMGGVDALKESWELTKGHKMNIFLLLLLQFVVLLAGQLACGLGGLVAQPIVLVSNAFVYMRLSGQQPRLPT